MELTGTEFRAESTRFIGTKITVLETKHGTGLTSGMFRGIGLMTRVVNLAVPDSALRLSC